jgi:hypothetical protein
MKISLPDVSWLLARECCRILEGHGRCLEDQRRRLIGTAGEVAASIFLTGTDDAFRSTFRERLSVDKGYETPDLEAFPDLEVKTVPHHLERPHFAIAAAGQRDPKVCDYLVLRCCDVNATAFEVLGWMPKGLIEQTFDACGGRFPSGSPRLPVDCLFPAISCPWRLVA